MRFYGWRPTDWRQMTVAELLGHNEQALRMVGEKQDG